MDKKSVAELSAFYKALGTHADVMAKIYTCGSIPVDEITDNERVAMISSGLIYCAAGKCRIEPDLRPIIRQLAKMQPSDA